MESHTEHHFEDHRPEEYPERSLGGSLIQPRDAIPAKWLSSFDSTPEGRKLDEYHRRLRADQELLQDLQWDGFAGPRWERVAEALVAYAYQVLLAWILTGEVFGKCLAQGLRGLGAGDQPRMQRRDAEELAYDVVGLAVVAFRDRVLKPGRWTAEAGATLKTFFVGQVLIQFIPIYKSWLRATRREEDLVEVVPDRPDGSALGRVEDAAVAAVEAGRMMALIPDPSSRAIVELAALGYSHEEIAELRDLASPKAVELRLYRLRRRLKGRS